MSLFIMRQSSLTVTLKHILGLILRNVHCAKEELQIKFHYICYRLVSLERYVTKICFELYIV